MAAPIKAFREFPAVKQAYTHIRGRLDTMIRTENRPELGAIDLPLWNYIHSCVPERFSIPTLGNAGTAIGPRCTEMVIPLLTSGQLPPQDYADRIMDSGRFEQFIHGWTTRELGGRPLGRKRARTTQSNPPSDSAES